MRALVLSGGGANGAFQAGVLHHVLGTHKVHYDIVAGVSVGALNGGIVSMYEKGDEASAAAHLFTEWMSIKGNSDIYEKWWWGLLPYPVPFLMKWKPSVYKTTPVKERVRERLDPEKLRASGKHFVCGAVEWGGKSEYRTWDQTHPEIVEAVLASSAFPIFFEPIEVDGRWYTDGGLRDVTPIKAAIDLGATRIDVIQAGSASLPIGENKPKGLDQMGRAINIILDEVDDSDYRTARMINHMVKHGCAMAPNHRLIELYRVKADAGLGDSLDFSPEKNRRLWEAGVNEAKDNDHLWV